ncbi:MAG: helix-turn-helix transcriptional regulator [Alphaproteobacteria bacterium]|nr:helix-turn-helix transcriptional regulator [Alphaproteobacteria bacterium]
MATSGLVVMSQMADEAAGLMRALSHGARLRVLCELVSGEKSAGELVAASGLSQSALSQHLARLRSSGLVATRRDARTIFYSLSDPRAERVIGLLFDLYCRN